MSGSKHFGKIAWAVTAVVLIITVLFMNGSALGLEAKAKVMGYENRLFDQSRVHTIDIVMDDWDGFIKTATSEEYSVATVVIDGEAYCNVGIRGKGNTSLSSVASMNSERYSFKIEFDQYDSTMSYHGLDKLSLNNLIQDNTMMKDYLVYTMMNEFGVNTPLCSYVNITVNGEDWGLYLAVEGVEDAFLQRNYGSDYGELYKPDSMNMGGGRGAGKDFNMDEFMERFEQEGTDSEGNKGSSGSTDAQSGASVNGSDGMTMPEGFEGFTMPEGFGDFTMPEGFGDFTMPEGSDNSERPEGFGSFSGFGGFGGFGMGSKDVKLQYIDDNPDSYSNIFDNAKTDITKADKNRLIDSLQSLSNQENLDEIVDMDQVLRYFVVHNYVCNSDSYTGSIVHNYYLYEEDGQLAMIPWDYNLAFGTMMSSGATSTVNSPIDSPVSGSAEDRPMLGWIFSDEEYTESYHEYFAEFLNTVDAVAIVDATYELIKPYVEKDPTKFCTMEEFEKGVATLRTVCELRTQSIEGQLDGSIPSTEEGQTADSSTLIDASSVTLNDMGSMGGGGFGGGKMPGTDRPDRTEDGKEQAPDDAEQGDTNRIPGGFGDFTMPEGFGGQMPEGQGQRPNRENPKRQ